MDPRIIAEYKGRYVKIKLMDGSVVRGKLDDVQGSVVKVNGKYIMAGRVMMIEAVPE